jgi:hypothetical protein
MSQQEQNDKSQYFYRASAADFMKIPGSPIAYWADINIVYSFMNFTPLSEMSNPHQGMATTNNDKFLRRWFEVDLKKCFFDAVSRDMANFSNKKWFPIDKGGEYRKWYGNNEFLVNYKNDGIELCEYIDLTSKVGASGRVINRHKYFLPGITWSAITSSLLSVRYTAFGHTFSNAGMKIFHESESKLKGLLALLNSSVTTEVIKCLSQTLNFDQGIIAKLPVSLPDAIEKKSDFCVQLARDDWDSNEFSWGFREPFFLCDEYISCNRISEMFDKKIELDNRDTFNLKTTEEEINNLFVKEYKLSNDFCTEVPLKHVTLFKNPVYLYGDADGGHINRKRSDIFSDFISFSIGCMMGRYSIDKPGLILASQVETLQDYLNQIPSPRFMPDNDAILPLTDQEWFADDVTNRVREFVKVVWGEETLQENLAFIAESLCLHAIKGKKGEAAIETIRRYLSTQFYKDHLKTYKKRPIYWLFSSGKEKAFECLVYLHRYNESTLARMRTEYVTPLMGKYDAQQSLLQEQLNDSSPAQQRELEKQLKDLAKKQTELRAFDENLKHYADMRIKLDLDDGVKVNYGKFGNLLADVKAITGDKGD